MPRPLPLRRALLLGLFLPTVLYAADPPTFEITPDHETGIYTVGETATWSVGVKLGEQAAPGEIKYWVRSGGLVEIDKGAKPLADGQAKVSAKRDGPGTLLLVVQYQPAEGKPVSANGGAVYDPDKIEPSAPEPDDFDEFWAAKLKELAGVPVDAKLEPEDSGDPNVEYYKLTMNNIRGTHIYGQLAKPKGKTDLPAMLQVQWAGVYPLQQSWVIGPAKNGWLALNIIAHDIPFDQPKEYYDNLNQTTLKGYPHIGREDRETSYFLRMYLSCYRAADYLANHPDWNGQTLIVQGGSQGGGQSLVTAGIHPKVTGLAADVPAMCDHTGQLVGRSEGWPKLTGWGLEPDNEQALETAKYFDAVNFAKRAKVKSAIVGVGLIDTTCPPAGCIAAFNALPCQDKQLAIMPISGHGGDHSIYYKIYGPYLVRQLKGE